MEKEIYLRFVRRICTAILVLLLLLVCNAQVMAEGYENALPALEEEAVEETLQAESYAAVAAQLEAVARTEGRSAADRMLYTGFSAVGPVSGTESIPASDPASDGGLSVIAVPEKQTVRAFSEAFPVLLIVLAVVGIVTWIAMKHRRDMRRMVYKPMRAAPVQRTPYIRYSTARTYR